MKLIVGDRRWRSLLGLALFAVLAPSLLTLMACLEVPIGAPEKSVVDPALSGAWLSVDDNSAEPWLWLLEPWDQRTWITTWVMAESAAPEETEGAGPREGLRDLEALEALESATVAVFKTWLTEIGGVRFLVLEPKVVLNADTGMAPQTWLAFAIVQAGPERLEMQLIDQPADATTTEETEARIAALAKDGKLFATNGQPRLFRRIGEAEFERVGDVFRNLGIGLE